MTDDYTADQIKDAIPEAIRRGDFEAVDGLLRLLAVTDPRAAQNVLDVIRIALEIRKDG
jgi:hypothetical protein